MLAAEEEHLPLQQGPVEFGADGCGERPGEVEPADLGADERALRDEGEPLVRPVLGALGEAPQEAGALVDAVGGDAVVAQERAGGRGGGRFRGDAHRSVSLCSEPRTRARGMVGRYRSRAGK